MKKLKKFLYNPAEKIMQRLPLSWKSLCFRKIKKILHGQYHDSEQELERQAREFVKKEITILFWGVLVLTVLGILVFCITLFLPDSRLYERKNFGFGETEIPLLLEKDGKQRTYSLLLEEQQLSSKELNSVFSSFFKDLEQNMKGKNVSLQNVTGELVFDESLDGYPFTITYDPEETDYIDWDGSLGEAFRRLRSGEFFSTGITVTAEYGDYCRSYRYDVQIKGAKGEQKGNIFQKTIENLQKQEKQTRTDKTFLLPKNYKEVTIEKEGKENHMGVLFFLGCILLFFFPVHNYMELRENEKRCRKETVQDFPVIVHLLTLYMGAGLSFASSVRRISEDYQKRQRKKKKKYAFEEIMRMDRQMRMGVSQKEACVSWGKQFEETMYHKLSFTLIQTISKGTREARVLMENTEKNAFMHRVDRAKKEGEEATTRLLFPMMVLLGLVMVLILFPAFMQFQGF